MKIRSKILVLSLLLLGFSISVSAQKAEPNEIKFAKGKSSAIVSDTLSNGQETDYVFAAKAGQKVSLKVTSKRAGNLFDFTIAGDGFDVPTEYDSYSEYKFTAPETGKYLLTVRKRPTQTIKSAKFSLTLSIE